MGLSPSSHLTNSLQSTQRKRKEKREVIKASHHICPLYSETFIQFLVTALLRNSNLFLKAGPDVIRLMCLYALDPYPIHPLPTYMDLRRFQNYLWKHQETLTEKVPEKMGIDAIFGKFFFCFVFSTINFKRGKALKFFF